MNMLLWLVAIPIAVMGWNAIWRTDAEETVRRAERRDHWRRVWMGKKRYDEEMARRTAWVRGEGPRPGAPD